MKKRYVIYTALIGGYDAIQQPLVVDNRFDYVLFTDVVRESKIGVWQIRKVDYTNANMIRIARYVKTHPMELLPDYDCSVWMDANLQITSSYIYEKAIELYNSEALIASVQTSFQSAGALSFFLAQGCERADDEFILQRSSG